MKKVLFTLFALLMAGSVCAQEEYFFVEDFEVPQSVLQGATPAARRMTVPVMAHFDRYVNVWMVDLVLPDGVVCKSADEGAGMTNIEYLNNLGETRTLTSPLNANSTMTRFIATISVAGFWYPEGSNPGVDDPVQYGAVKFALGEYEMFNVILEFDPDFEGGEISLVTSPASGIDSRGPITSADVTTHTCNVTAESAPALLDLTGEIVIGDPDQSGQVAISYNGTEAVSLSATINGNAAGIMQNHINLPYEGEHTITVVATANGYNPLTATKTVEWTTIIPEEENYLSVPDTEVFCGDTIIIPVRMTNSEKILNFQTDVFLPEGFSVVKRFAACQVTGSDRLSSGHVLVADEVSNGAVRVLCYSTDNVAIAGNEGDLFYIKVASPRGAEGDFEIRLQNTLLTTWNGLNEIEAPDATANIHVISYIPGDVNNSRTVTVTDLVVTAQYIVEHNPSPFIFRAGDMNNDGRITVTDMGYISRIILNIMSFMASDMNSVLTDGFGMSADDVTLAAGETRTVSINLDNALDISGFQMDMNLPAGLTASNFRLTDRAGKYHALEVNTLSNGKTRVLCYSPSLQAISGNSGATLTFDVTATGAVSGEITVDGIEGVTPGCQTVLMDMFGINVNSEATGVNELDAINGLRIYGDGQFVIIESPVAQAVTVSDIAGRAQRVNVAAGRTAIPVDHAGVYVVTAGGKVAKLMLK